MVKPLKLINNQRRIGLTGGIACGKSTITDYIRKNKKNILIVDADNISRQLIKPNTKGYEKILKYFGNQIIDENSPEKAINKKLLREIIFEDEQDREWIQNLLHPLIKEKMIEVCKENKNHKTILLVIPLLFEAKFKDICTEIWLVKCSSKQQVQRLIKRDNISEEKAWKIIKLQLSFEAKAKSSDVILDNSDETKRWINRIKELI